MKISGINSNDDKIIHQCKLSYDENDIELRKRVRNYFKGKVKRWEFEEKTFIYSTEAVAPLNKDKYSIVFVVGNPAIHSVEYGFPYSFAKGKNDGPKAHPFWGILRNAGILEKKFNKVKGYKIHEIKNIIDFGEKFRNGEYNGDDYKSIHVGIYPFFSIPTDKADGVKRLENIFKEKYFKLKDEEEGRFKTFLKYKVREGSLIVLCTKKIIDLKLGNIIKDCKMEKKEKILIGRSAKKIGGDKLRKVLRKYKRSANF